MQFEPDFDFEIPPTPQNLTISMATLPTHFQIKTFIPKIMDKFNSSSNKGKEIIDNSNLKETFEIPISDYLDLSHNKYEIFRSSQTLLDYSQQIIDLDLSSNEIVFFPVELVHLTNLKLLKLDFNKIKAISNEIYKLENLEFFSISNNLLQDIVPCMTQMKNLKCLNLGRNLIASLNNVVQLTQLEVLYIYGNIFPSLPLSIYPLINKLNELALEWFKYTRPPLPPILNRKQNGPAFKKMANFINERSSYMKNSDDIRLIEFLILFSDENFDVFAKDEKNRTILHHAAIEDEIGMISAFANLKKETINKTQKNINDFFKCKKLNRDDSIPERSINISANHSFHVQEAKNSIKKLVVERQFDKKNNHNQNKYIDELDIDSHTALSLAILEGKFRAAEILLNLNSDVNKGGGIFGSVLHLAVIKLRKDLVEKILSSFFDINKSDLHGNTALHLIFSIFSKDPSQATLISDLLLNSGLNSNLINKEKLTALHLAFKKNQLSAIAYALNRYEKIDLNKRAGVGKWTVFQLASHLGDLEVMETMGRCSHIDVFKKNGEEKDALKLSFQAIAIIKLNRKFRRNWIVNNILKRTGRKRGLKINDAEEMIEKTMKKKKECFGKHKEVNRGLLKIIENNLGQVDLTTNEYDCEELDETDEISKKMQERTNLTEKNFFNTFLDLKNKKKKEEEDSNACFFNSNLRFFELFSGLDRNYSELLREFQGIKQVLLKKEVILEEKLNFLFFLKVIYEKTFDVDRSFDGIQLPVQIHMINELFSYEKKNSEVYRNKLISQIKAICEESLEDLLKALAGCSNLIKEGFNDNSPRKSSQIGDLKSSNTSQKRQKLLNMNNHSNKYELIFLITHISTFLFEISEDYTKQINSLISKTFTNPMLNFEILQNFYYLLTTKKVVNKNEQTRSSSNVSREIILKAKKLNLDEQQKFNELDFSNRIDLEEEPIAKPVSNRFYLKNVRRTKK